MLKKSQQRRGVTLLDLLAVVTLIAIVAAVAMMRYGRSVMGDFGSQAQARIVSVALLHAQRASITTGDNHYLQFDAVNATTYSLFRRTGGGDTLVDGPYDLSDDVAINVSDTVMEFNFEGQALGPYVVTFVGDNRTWQLDVIPINGSIQVAETTP